NKIGKRNSVREFANEQQVSEAPTATSVEDIGLHSKQSSMIGKAVALIQVPNQRLFGTKAAARYLGLHEQTLRKLTDLGELAARKMGSRGFTPWKIWTGTSTLSQGGTMAIVKNPGQKGLSMAINRERDRNGQMRIVVSKRWPDKSRFRRYCPNTTVAKTTLARIEESIAMGTWRDL